MGQAKREPISLEQVRAIRRAEARSSLTGFLAFFIVGLSVVLSLNRSTGELAWFAWFVIPLGLVCGVTIFLVGRRWAKAS
jgi:undecaprenyl pyrophosphate phosphatase UppP